MNSFHVASVAGRLDASGQSLDKPCRAEDVLKLYEGNQALKVLRHSFKVYARQQHLTETSLRRQLEKLEGVPYLKQVIFVELSWCYDMYIVHW